MRLTADGSRTDMPRYDNIEELEPDFAGAGLRIGIVVSRFNTDIGEGLLSSCTDTLQKQGVTADRIRIVSIRARWKRRSRCRRWRKAPATTRSSCSAP